MVGYRACIAALVLVTLRAWDTLADVPGDMLSPPDIYLCPHCGTEYNIDNATCIGDYCYVTGPNNTIVELYHPEPCVIEGHLSVKQNWYGYLSWIVFDRVKGKFLYEFSYPEDRCCINVLLYLEEQVDLLRAFMYCEQRQDFANKQSNQVIDLTPDAPWAGCKNTSDLIKCSGGRMLRSDINRKWYIAAANCNSPNGLEMDYKLHIYGYHGACPSGPRNTASFLLPVDTLVLLSTVYCTFYYCKWMR